MDHDTIETLLQGVKNGTITEKVIADNEAMVQEHIQALKGEIAELQKNKKVLIDNHPAIDKGSAAGRLWSLAVGSEKQTKDSVDIIQAAVDRMMAKLREHMKSLDDGAARCRAFVAEEMEGPEFQALKELRGCREVMADLGAAENQDAVKLEKTKE